MTEDNRYLRRLSNFWIRRSAPERMLLSLTTLGVIGFSGYSFFRHHQATGASQLVSPRTATEEHNKVFTTPRRHQQGLVQRAPYP